MKVPIDTIITNVVLLFSWPEKIYKGYKSKRDNQLLQDEIIKFFRSKKWLPLFTF